MAREDLHFRLRIPEDVKALIEHAANENDQSMTAEIVHRLKRSFDKDIAEDAWNSLWDENHKLRSEIAAQDTTLQRITEMHHTLTVMAKAVADAFLSQGERSDVLRVLAEGLREVNVDLSFEPKQDEEGSE